MIVPLAASLLACACSNEDSKKNSVSVNDPCAPSKIELPHPIRKQSSQGPVEQSFDIIIRDFDVSHPDFETFALEAANSIQAGTFSTWMSTGYVEDPDWQLRRAQPESFGCASSSDPSLGIPIGASGYPSAPNPSLPAYIQAQIDISPDSYGEFEGCASDPMQNPLGLRVLRGSENEIYNTKLCRHKQWSQTVYITPGMASPNLIIDPSVINSSHPTENATITKNRSACDNNYFEQWFSDVAGVNKSFNSTLTLSNDYYSNAYTFNKNWNNGGFFPLDSIGSDFNYIGPNIELTLGEDSFGPQTLSIFCPPYDYQYANSQTDFLGNNTYELCLAWLANGGPKTGSAAITAAMTSPLGIMHLRNYGFTMEGAATFEYHKGAGETFEIYGDDDIWVYVDGVLVVDLGGAHPAAKGIVDMDYLASNSHGCNPGEPLASRTSAGQNCDLDELRSWKDGSWHFINFYHAKRQSDGSNFRIRSTLSKLERPSASSHVQPTILKATVHVDKNGKATTLITTNSQLSEATLINMQEGDEPLILAYRPANSSEGLSEAVYGFYISSIAIKGEGPDGSQYEIKGTLKDINGDIVESGILGGDALAFTTPFDMVIFEEARQKCDSPECIELLDQVKSWSAKVKTSVTSVSGDTVENPKELFNWAIADYTSEATGNNSSSSENKDDSCED